MLKAKHKEVDELNRLNKSGISKYSCNCHGCLDKRRTYKKLEHKQQRTISKKILEIS